MAALVLGIARREGGDAARAAAAFAEAATCAEAAGDLLLTLNATTAQAGMAGMAEARGRLREAAEIHRRALRLATDEQGHAGPVAGLPHVGLGKVLREQNDLDAALEHLRTGIELGRQGGLDGIVVDGSITLALASAARGEFPAARAALAEARELVRGWNDPDTPLRLDAFEARLHLAEGRLDAAVRWAEASPIGPDDAPSERLEIEHATLARILIARERAGPGEGHAERALALLDRLLAAAEAAGRLGRTIELLALRALALDVMLDRDGAVAALARALALAEPEGYVRTFADQGAPMARLLAALRTTLRRSAAPKPVPSPAYMAAVLAALGPPTPAASGSTPATPEARTEAPPPLPEPLSDRELEVLRLMAAGADNRRIARELVVGVSTVKTHVNRVFRKLDATSRTEAVARARALGRLPA